MTHFKKFFPSKYLQASDLETPVEVIIKSFSNENVGSERDDLKLVVHFHETDVKSLIVNLTRAEAIAMVAGTEDVDRWIGVRIRLERGWTRFQGKRVACIVVKPPAGGNSRPKAKDGPSGKPLVEDESADEAVGF